MEHTPHSEEATVPAQPKAQRPMSRTTIIVFGLIALIFVGGFVNLRHSMHMRAANAVPMAQQPFTANPQQVAQYKMQQVRQAQADAAAKLQEAQVEAALAQANQPAGFNAAPGPEAQTAPPMTEAQRQAIYGNSPNAPQQTSDASQAHAQAAQAQLAKAQERQQALDSDTVAVDFSHSAQPAVSSPGPAAAVPAQPTASAQAPSPVKPADVEQNPMGGYPFDSYHGKLYRMFEGTVLEGVVTNHIDGGFSGPILIMLTTDYYSHDHQELLLPQGTRLIGTVQSVGSQQQRKLMVVFHRAICPDGFSVSLDNFAGLDPLGTMGLATKVDHGYLQAFGAAAMIGGLGGLAQIGNSGSILTPGAEIQNGISEQSAMEGEQVLNHFLNRLPIITLKEGSRARVYINQDLLVPSYAEHTMDPTL